ncbi:MAG: hypothetical protein EZS28_032530 [Streblomastix strix]|uniref:Uncharacterized protein n=1 Tax=Streblomastix strix TaxID=222440 RepID=A0A5J4UP53_9EUKA|nr:MAG: hypothetical protein EZS28_032530 [Streblomastix strix]
MDDPFNAAISAPRKVVHNYRRTAACAFSPFSKLLHIALTTLFDANFFVNDVKSCDLLTEQCFKALLTVITAIFPKNEDIDALDLLIYGAVRASEALRFRHNYSVISNIKS